MMGPPRKMPSRLSASRNFSTDKAERSSSAPPIHGDSTTISNSAKERLEHTIKNWKRKSVSEKINRLLLEQLMLVNRDNEKCAFSDQSRDDFFEIDRWRKECDQLRNGLNNTSSST
ncbi:unnamed protein product [Caenorhabditis auriculariae]|uniref:Uncharacterized protein n=1 Tax=Caenorhabditis auriculariae TaxID=2777116 RepID=A0A8S1HGC1_9PELO|nr:unnamed protein product [Caenorhabditis auriculariae]